LFTSKAAVEPGKGASKSKHKNEKKKPVDRGETTLGKGTSMEREKTPAKRDNLANVGMGELLARLKEATKWLLREKRKKKRNARKGKGSDERDDSSTPQAGDASPEEQQVWREDDPRFVTQYLARMWKIKKQQKYTWKKTVQNEKINVYWEASL
jgi:hypothetical protein